MIRISHPRPAAGRQKFIGIEFRDGVAEAESLHPEVQASLLQHGYGIEGEPEASVKKRRKRQSDPVEQFAQQPVELSVGLVTVTIDGGEFVFDASETVSITDLRELLDAGSDTDIWLAGDPLDTKIDGEWQPTEGAVIRTAPRIINGG